MDIRLVRGRQQRLGMWIGGLVGVLLLALASAWVFGDATQTSAKAGVGANANFGADRGEVIPVVTEPFEAVAPLSDRELGRILYLAATAESAARRNAVWVRTARGRRILVRFEPEPAEGALRGIYPGAAVRVNGYLQKISRAELDVWLDSLGVTLPRPQPGVKFGDLPDSNFARVDSLFIKNYYVSVRPEGINAAPPKQAAAPPAPAAAPVPLPRADSAKSEDTPAPPPPTPEETRADTGTGGVRP